MIIRLINMGFFAKHGVSKEEQAVGNKYEADVAVGYYVESKDDIQATLDYGLIYSAVESLMMKHSFHLLETMAKLMAESIMTLSFRINYVTVRVRKRNPPIGSVCDYAEVEFTLNQPD
ncbi:hypothetical protein CHS0354_000424 [Potamilus streckersoni]|uniref:dihydroneopterin aldolase n=1 Tax=Potamilus streckersoni TaxID=2493646 RepID=A0AAE0T6X6_9BIVA|nr:hypothetical protein CHS0354_000424 [Potamilus streckersoni]